MGLLGDVEKALGALPYRDAKPALQSAELVRDVLQSMFPGGHAGPCDYCDQHIGYSDVGATDHENGGVACRDCCDRLGINSAREAVEGGPLAIDEPQV